MGLDQLDDHAAKTRLECYRYFGAELPLGGREPTLTPRAKIGPGLERAQANLDEPTACVASEELSLVTRATCGLSLERCKGVGDRQVKVAVIAAQPTRDQCRDGVAEDRGVAGWPADTGGIHETG